jgi:uncharacterized OB-fold protein
MDVDMELAQRPIPLPDDATWPFWRACAEGRLAMQRCAECRVWRFPPRPMCPRCQSLASEWVTVSGRGTIYSFVIAHGPVLPAFAERVPLPIVLVVLAEDPALRLVGNLVGDEHAGLRIGAAVEVAFEPIGDGLALPQWRIVP